MTIVELRSIFRKYNRCNLRKQEDDERKIPESHGGFRGFERD